jgi:hypothetical protein
VRSARSFSQLLQIRQPAVTIRLTPADGHTMLTWRLLLPPMLSWMTRGLAQQVALYYSLAARARRHDRHARRGSHGGQPRLVPTTAARRR